MTITCMMRVRNEARWISEVLASIHPLTKDILILDDHSSDGTPALCAAAGATVIHSPFPEDQKDEARDKNFLLNVILEHNTPDYVLAIDGDEVLEAGAADRLRELLLQHPEISWYSFPVRYLWGDRLHYRVDGVYEKYQRQSMFSLRGAVNPHYASTKYGCNFHCGQVPLGLPGSGCNVSAGADLLHLGYMLAEDRIRKYEFYNRMDPGNQYEDFYRHVAQGDLPELPADAKFLHGGPLRIFPLSASKWPSFVAK